MEHTKAYQEFKKNGNTKFVRYLVNEKEAEAFDREFPYMEKKKLPGQIFEGDIR